MRIRNILIQNEEETVSKNNQILVSVAVLILFGSWSAETAAQMGVGGGGGGEQGAYALEEGERNLNFAAVPIPNYSDVLGASLGLVGMAYYKLDRHDDDLPPSSTGIFGFYSANNSWIGAAFQTLHMDHDKWRVKMAGGTGSINFQFNPGSLNPGLPDVFLDYTTATDFFFVSGQRKTWKKLYLGLAAVSWAAKVDLNLDQDLVEIPKERYSGPAVIANWDARDHIMQPTRGFLVQTRGVFYMEGLGSSRDFQKLNVTLTGYHSLADSTKVLAGRLLSEIGFGDVPFSGQSILNGNRNLRGYSNGRHRGDRLTMLEAEYRWNFYRRWGAVAFAGVAWVADTDDPVSWNDPLLGAGVGLRFLMIEAYRINARVDVAWGDDDKGIYIGIGEVF